MTTYTQEERAAFIANIRALPAKLAELVDGLSDEELTTVYIENEWTVAQVVHHLMDAHINAYIRLRLILTEDRPKLAGYDQEGFAELTDAKTAKIDDSLNVLRGLHSRWAKLFDSLTDEQWARIGLVRETREITPDYLVQLYSWHGDNHLDQIRKILEVRQ